MGYDKFKTIAAAKRAYRRVRTRVQTFVLEDGCRELNRVTCPVCGRKLADDPETTKGYQGNRCEYFPKTKKVVGMHYMCSWQVTMKAVWKLADYLL